MTRSFQLADIHYRRATWQDHPILRQFRVECGWGLERMENDLKTADDTPLWVFSIVDTRASTEDGMVDIGMGGLVLESTAQPALANRKTETIKVTSLYITHSYQGTGLGKLCLDLLEKLAIEEYGAKHLTLDTTAHSQDTTGRDIPGTISRNIQWYNRRGYVEFLDRKPQYAMPNMTNPEYILIAAFLRRTV